MDRSKERPRFHPSVVVPREEIRGMVLAKLDGQPVHIPAPEPDEMRIGRYTERQLRFLGQLARDRRGI